MSSRCGTNKLNNVTKDHDNGFISMTNLLKIYEHEQLGEIRIMTGNNGEPWFVGKDVARVLGYAQPQNAIAAHVDIEDRTTTLIQETDSNYKTQVVIINKSGLYSLIISSKLPQACEFKRWITSDVLPTFRRTGRFPINQDKDKISELNEIEILARAFQIQQRTIKEKNASLEAQKGKVIFADAITSSSDCILIRELAKILTQNGVEIGEKRLYSWLRQNNFICKYSTEPLQKWVSRGFFTIKKNRYKKGKEYKFVPTTMVTGKGQEFFLEGFINGRFKIQDNNIDNYVTF